ncbi:MAG: hypothetical protein ACLSVG_08235 [Clostridia bacterium]
MDDPVTIHSKYAELPLVKVLERLGIRVIWRDNYTADVIFEEKQYVLDLTEITLIEKGDDINLVLTPPGGYSCHKAMEKELILSDGTMSSAFYLMGLRATVDVDHEKRIVTITDRKD